MLYLVPVVILSFMHITCTNTLFHICQAFHDGSFFCFGICMMWHEQQNVATDSYFCLALILEIKNISYPNIKLVQLLIQYLKTQKYQFHIHLQIWMICGMILRMKTYYVLAHNFLLMKDH